VPAPTTTTSYSERLYVPLSWWFLGGLFVLSVGWAFWVATPLVATAVAVIVSAVLVGWWLVGFGRVRVAVDEGALHAGRAVLPRDVIGAVNVLDHEGTRRALGQDADARAFLVTRPYCRQAVKVEVADAADPTPYWIISSRDPERLASSLRSRGVRD
jgi:hypothetical protein